MFLFVSQFSFNSSKSKSYDKYKIKKIGLVSASKELWNQSLQGISHTILISKFVNQYQQKKISN